MYEERLAQLRGLCEEYGLKEEIVLSHDNRDYLSDIQLIHEMAYGLNEPFLLYKSNSNLKRTYIKCKLMKRHMNKTERILEEAVDVGKELIKM